MHEPATYAIAVLLRVEALQRQRAAGIDLGLLGVLMLLMPRHGGAEAAALPWAVLALAGPMLLAAGNLFRSLAWPPGLHPPSAASLMPTLQALLVVPGAAALGQLALPVVVGQLGYVITVATLLLGVFMFGERHGATTFAAVATVFAGIMLVHRAAPDAPQRRRLAAAEARR
ncbi:hypothetical protein [Variovorax sp. YR752]|uniref:hypothetical protein n=1 Tax=Variovorax sp. YR752 TaxID=1884383 RepID=UPI0031379CE4